MSGATASSADTKSAEKQPVVLLDNNIIQLFLRKQTAKHMQPLLQQIIDGGVRLATSNIILYEALKAIVFDGVKTKAVASFIDTYLMRYAVDDTILINAARVHEMYGSEQATKKFRDKYSTEDIVLATTSMLFGAYVITSDCNDFPLPFFREISRQMIAYEDGNRRKHFILHLLQPDREIIGMAMARLNKSPD